MRVGGVPRSARDYTHETYDGALHGWTMPDFPIYNHDAAERVHAALAALFRRPLA